MATRELHDCDTAAAVISFVRAEHQAEQAAAAHKLAAAVTWAGIHADPDDLSLGPGAEGMLEVAGEGAPMVSEFCVHEFAVAIGLSSDAGRAYLSHAVELAHRLPQTYARVVALDLPAWKAQRIAKQTIWLSPDAAAHVDLHLAPVAHEIGPVQLDRLIDEAALRHDPVEAAERARAGAEARRFDIDTHQVSFDGHVQVGGVLDLADALDLEDAVARGAKSLAGLDGDLSLDVRRSIAVGDLARRQLALDLNVEAEPRSTKPRQVVVHVHLAGAAIARVENIRSVIWVEQVQSWCTNPDTQVVIKPVIDLADHEQVGAYEVPDRIRERQVLLQHSCVFPWCNSTARRADIDHVEAAARGGPTADQNLAPLCRQHHRLKTHSRWRYDKTGPTTFVWRSPVGLIIRRDHTGTEIRLQHPQP